MTYVFDSGPFILMFKYYYPERFPTLWELFDALIKSDDIVSVKEVYRELEGQDDGLSEWVAKNKSIFGAPGVDELAFVAEIFKVKHFQTLIRKQSVLLGKPAADPFVIAKAKIIGGCVVTEEKEKPNSAKLPNVCVHFGVPCMSLEEFMVEENWKF